MKRRRVTAPRFAIAAILEELGAEDIPDGTGWLGMRCYGHDDIHPSARVNHDKGAYVCFSCERWGDAIALIKAEYGLNYEDALAKCEEIAGRANRPVRPQRKKAWGN